MSGENYISKFSQIKRIIKTFIRQGRFCTDFYDSFPPYDISGAHYFRLADYHLLFRLLGYKLSFKIVGKTSVVLMAIKLRE